MVTQNLFSKGGLESRQPLKTILADPPWDVQQKGALGAASHYKLMTLDHIQAMPIADLAAVDAHCWLCDQNIMMDYDLEVYLPPAV